MLPVLTDECADASDEEQFDSDASAFFSRAGITDGVQRNALNALVLGLKFNGIWPKLLALYPLAGAAATPHSFNLVSAGYPVVWHGSLTHDTLGVKSDGTTGYGSCTGLTPTVVGNFGGIAVYNNASIGSNRSLMGEFSNPNVYYIGKRVGAGLCQGGWSPANNVVATVLTPGFYAVNRSTLSRMDYYRNGLSIGSNTSTVTMVLNSFELFLCCSNSSGTPGSFSDNYLAAFAVFTSLTDAQHLSLYQTMQTYQTALGRQV